MLVCLLVLWQGMGWADNDRSNLCHQFYYDINGDRTFKSMSDVDGIFDFNRDGSVDLWKNEHWTNYRTTVSIKVPEEDNLYEGEKIFYESSGQYKMEGFADFNNDGYVDGYYFDAPKGQDYYNLVIVKGKPIEEWPCTQTIVIPLPECSSENTPDCHVLDYDNNGYLDIKTRGFNLYALYLMDKDFHYTKTKNPECPEYDEYHWQPLTPDAYPNGYKSNIKNEAPSAPTHVTATSAPEGLLLKWDKATFEMGDTIATIVFKEVGKQTLLPHVKIENDLTLSEQFNTTVVDETMPTAEIKSVESNGKYYQVNWSADVPSMVSKVEVSRETNRLNKFEVLDIVPVGNATYVDLSSDNRVQPQRYRIRLITENEMQHSDYSAVHNPLHVMINKTADKKGNNLMWNVYEGLEVTSYIIMRGSSEKNLKAIATISGSQQNYTDYDAPAGVSYYAVKFETNTSASAKAMGRMAASEDVSSNVISSEEAMPTTQATTLYAGTIESIAKLSNNQQQLHMVATILPTYVTFNKVSWSIVSGGEYASISQSGLLTAKGGKGDVVVRVVTLDGSNLSCDITIPCDVNILATDIDVRASKKTVNVGDYLLLNVVLAPKNTTMNEVTWKSENTYVAIIDENGIMKAVSAGTAKITATTKDGSNLSAFINITVIDPSGIRGITTKDENEDTELYDLEGRKIQVPQKGHIYITNKGQKIAF